MSADNSVENNQWFRLDNAGKIYPAAKRKNWSSVFRMAVKLKSVVDPDILQVAFNKTLKRFPQFKVRMRKGLFWYYLETNPNPPPEVMEDIINPCLRVRWRDNNGYLIKIYYYQKRISVEIFHALTDGTGLITFLKTMTAEYIRLTTGQAIPCEQGILDLTQEPDPEEMEDAYRRYANSKAKIKRMEPRAYHYRGHPEKANTLNIVTGIVPTDAALKVAREKGATLTELMAAALLYSLYQTQLEEGPRWKSYLPVKVSVPINMRSFFPSKTLRNFSLYVNPGIDPNMGEYDFDEIISQVSAHLKYYINAKRLNAMMTANVVMEKNPILRLAPLFLKNFAMSNAFVKMGEDLYSTTLSNLGLVKVPPEMSGYIDSFEFLLGSSLFKTPNCAMVSFGNKLTINISGALKEPELERRFFRLLVELGIPVKIESNRQ